VFSKFLRASGPSTNSLSGGSVLVFILFILLLAQNTVPNQHSKPQHQENKSNKASNSSKPLQSDTISEPISRPITYNNTANYQDAPENKRNDAAAWVTAFLTAAYVVISTLMWWSVRKQAKTADESLKAFKDQATLNSTQFSEQLEVMRKQLKEMENAGGKTDRLIHQNIKQAEALGSVASASHQSARSAQSSVELQTTAQKQWVNLQKWEITRLIETPTEHLLQFEIDNPTTTPLTLFTLSLEVNGTVVPTTHDPLNLLTPKNPFPVSAIISFSENDEQVLASGNNVFPKITCSISFIDAFGGGWEQVFGRYIMYGPSTTEVLTQTVNRLVATKILNPDEK
jgi:hypothetical protein